MRNQNLPIAVLLGDPSGIGPELISRLLNDIVTKTSNIVIIGDRQIFEAGEKIANTNTDIKFIKNLDEIIKNTSESAYHPSCTNKMGEDKTSVVDQSLKVHGIKNLRVVDASVMPDIVSANLNATTIMIAEKAYDEIKS